MPKLLLINPSNTHKGLGNIRSTAWPPLNLPYVAALTPDHYKIEVIDENIEPFKFQKADIVGITSYTSSVSRGYEIAQMYRKKGIPTVMGGIHVSMMPEEALNYCDAVVVGEAEGVWPKVLEDFEAGSLKKQYRGSWPDLAHLPIPRRDILQNDYYTWGSIQTSRGCPMNCVFCSVTAFNGRRFRRRHLEAVIDELEQIPQKYVMITDDNLIGYSKEDRDWARLFFSRIIEKGIKKTFFAQSSIQFGEDLEFIQIAARGGLKILFIGFESVNPESLKAYQKGVNLKRLQQDKYHELISRIRSAGIAIIGAFVLGCDDDDLSIFHSTLEFVESSGMDVLQITKPTPLPGTQLWHDLLNEGRILNLNFPKAWEDYRLTKMVYKPAKMSIEDVYAGFTYIRTIYYGFWQTLKRTIDTLLTTKSLVATILAYKFNASYRRAFINSEHRKIYNHPGLRKKFRIGRSTGQT
ncbi:MAG: radical SAM protein [Desulfobacterales bacterium]|jgi:radical SAM superfamily enzyme YgiQ (UPF0313 family)